MNRQLTPPAEEIRVLPKPDSLSDDELWQMIYASHERNRQQGLKINTRISDGRTLRQHMGDQAVTWVAYAGDTPAGTVSARIEQGQHRLLRGRQTVYLMHLAVLPAFSGRGIGKMLCDQALEYARQQQAEAATLHVVHRNPALGFYQRLGFEELDFIPRFRLKQNTVYMVYWLRPCAEAPWKRRLRYRLKKAYIKLRYRFA